MFENNEKKGVQSARMAVSMYLYVLKVDGKSSYSRSTKHRQADTAFPFFGIKPKSGHLVLVWE